MALCSALRKLESTHTGPLYYDDRSGVNPDAWSVPSPNRETIASARELRAVVARHRLVMGHYGGPQLVDAGCAALAVQLREPRSRLLSLYRYWQSRSESELASRGRWGSSVVAKAALPFLDFVSQPDGRPATDNVLVRQTLGVYTRAGATLWGALRLTRAYRALQARLLIAEWTSSSERFLERVCERLGVANVPSLGRENITEVTGEQQQLDAETRRRIDQLTSVDQLFLDRLCSDGVLARRSRRDLDSEFELTAARLGFDFI
jgi:hypothetical protein